MSTNTIPTPLVRLDSWNAEHFAAQGKAVSASSSDMGDLGGLGRMYYFHCSASGMSMALQ